MTAGRRVWFSSLCTLLLLAGCRSAANTNNQLLESELAAKETLLQELKDEHEKTENHARALEREVDALRKGSKLSPEQASQTFNTQRIVIGRTTSGQDLDKKTGDDALQIVVEPRDGSDHIIKTPGKLRVWVLEISPQGVKTPFMHAELSPEELARSWKSGLLSNGYYVTLRWKSYPTTESLRVIVQLVTSDGRVFEADRDVRVQLLPGVERLRHPPLDKGIEFPPPPPMHMPRPLDDQSRTPPANNAVAPAGLWQPAPLDDVVKLGRPVPLE